MENKEAINVTADENIEVEMPEIGTATDEAQAETDAQTVKELTAKLAALESKYQKVKVQNDKMSKAEAEYKRQAREGMSATERELEILKEEVESLKEANSELTEYKNLNEAKSRFMLTLDMNEDMARKAAEADISNNRDGLADILRQHQQDLKRAMEAEFKMSRGPISAGGDFDGMSKDEIMQIKDRSVRRRAIAEHQELFK